MRITTQSRHIAACLIMLVMGFMIAVVRFHFTNQPAATVPAKMPHSQVNGRVGDMEVGQSGWIDWNSIAVDFENKTWLDTAEYTRPTRGSYEYVDTQAGEESQEWDHFIQVTKTKDGYDLRIPSDYRWQSEDISRRGEIPWSVVHQVTLYEPPKPKPEPKVGVQKKAVGTAWKPVRIQWPAGAR